jgi:tetratricopeptide (TPR) repeat protein
VLLNKSIEMDQSYYPAYTNKIAVYWNLKDYSSALSVSEKLTTLFPGRIEGWQISGMLSDIMGDTLKARQCHSKTLDLLNAQIARQKNDDSMKIIRFNRALTLLLLGNENEAKKEIQLVKDLFPKDQLPSDDIIDQYFAMSKSDYMNVIKGISNIATRQ